MRIQYERELRRSIANTLGKFRSLTATAATGVAVVTSLPGMALAQESGGVSLEEVVVTAQRRTERLQDIPVAVSALSNDDLVKAGVERFADLERNTPSLTVADGPGGRFLNIRGVGIGVSTPFQTAGVPLHVDGLYIPRSEFFLRDAYFDLERLELYRGPQGTFAGQNSTGGAIFVVANQPQFEEMDFGIEQTFGSYNLIETEAFVNMPISEKWAARVAVINSTRDGFADFNGPGQKADTPFGYGNSNNIEGNATIGADNRRSVRGILRYKPSDALDVRLRYDYIKDQGNGEANARAPANSFNDPDQLINPRNYYSDFRGWLDTQVHRALVNVEWELSDSLLLKSVTGYQYLRSDAGADTDGTSPFVVIDPTIDWNPAAPGIQTYPTQGWAITRTDDDYYYQEFDLVSTGEGPLQWVVGAVGLKQDSLFNNNNGAYTERVINTTTGPVVVPPTPDYLNAVPPGSWLDYHQRHMSWAVFGDLTYAFSDQFEAKVGARYTYDEIELEKGSTVRSAATGQISQCGTGPCNVFGIGEFDAVTGRFALNWFPGGDRGSTVFLSYNIGFKPGGYISQFTVQQQATDPKGHPPYKEETLYNYEIGYKTSLGWLQTSISAFYMDYRDYQAQFRIPGQAIPRSQNIPKTEVKGADLQARAAFGNLGLNLNVGYVDSEIQDSSLLPIVPANYYAQNCPLYTGAGPASTAAAPPAGVAACPSYVPPLVFAPSGATNSYFLDPAGLPLNFAPEWTYNLSVEYNIPIGDDGTLTPWVQYSFIDEQWTQLTHGSQDFIPSRELVDFRLSYTKGDHWRVEGYVTNVFDELYVSGIAGGPTTTPYYASVALGAPRQYGLKIRYNY